MGERTIAVVIPCYNHGRYLEEAVDSVFAQTWQDFEILIVNDGSTDPETNRLLDGWNRPRTRVVRTENRGLPGARNVGIRLTSAPFVCPVDADDILEPTWFARAMEVFEQEPEVAFVSHWLRTFGDEEWEWTPERCDLLSLLDMNTVNGAAVARRAVLEDVGLFDESMRDGCEDWDLWLRVVERGHRGVIVPDFLFRYRRRADSMSREMNRPAMQLDLFRRLIERHRGSYREHLVDLVQRRETSLGDLLGEMWDLDAEYHGWWKPELERRRAEAEALRRRVEAIRVREAAEEEHARQAQALAEAEARIAELAALEDRNRHLEADLEGHRQALANAEAELEELRAARAADAEALEAHAEALAASELQVAELRGAGDAAAEAERHVKADLEGHRQALANAEEELAELRAIQDAQAAELADAQHRHGAAAEEVEALRGSLSWRLMAPLRLFGGGGA